MRVISYKTIREYAAKNPAAKTPLDLWWNAVKDVSWQSHADLKLTFPSADYVGNERYVFNIGGNKFRLIAAIHFGTGIIYLKFVGTHREYDAVDAATVNKF